jgi:hypothetical protein
MLCGRVNAALQERWTRSRVGDLASALSSGAASRRITAGESDLSSRRQFFVEPRFQRTLWATAQQTDFNRGTRIFGVESDVASAKGYPFHPWPVRALAFSARCQITVE